MAVGATKPTAFLFPEYPIMAILTGSDLAKWFGSERIFEGIHFSVERGDKIALVGPNGAGKSTLLKIIAGSESSTEGGVGNARGLRVAYLAQEAHFEPGQTLLESAESAFSHLHAIEAELRELEQRMGDTDDPDWHARMER